jgi:hypothetical protein
MIDKKTRSVVTKNDRKMLVNWCFGIVDSFSFSRETVVVTFNLLDRFLSVPSEHSIEALISHCEFQLLAVVSLYIAIKISETSSISRR